MYIAFKVGPTLALLALTTLVAAPSFAAPLHDYQLNGTYADAFGGPPLSPDGGTLGPTGYTFAANQGLNVSSITNGSVYSIDMVFQFTDVTGYRKILDFSNLGPDTGLYVHDGALNFYNVATGSSTIAATQTSDMTLDVDRIMSLYQERWQVEMYHKSLKRNASLACSPTRTKTTQSNHFFLSLCAYVKLETMKIRTKCSHFALKSKLYVAALQAAFGQWQTLQPNNLRMSA